MFFLPVLPAADSLFADNAFTGRWNTPFEPVVFAQLGESEGAGLTEAMKAGATADCPSAAEKREFYRGKGTRTTFLVSTCTNGNRISGVFTRRPSG